MFGDDPAHELRILLHHHPRKIEPAVGHRHGLLLKAMMRQRHVEAAQIGVIEQIAHEMRRARILRSDADGDAAQVGELLERAIAPGEQQERLGLGQPPKHLEPRARGHGRAVLNEAEHRRAVCRRAGQAVYVFDRPLRWRRRSRRPFASRTRSDSRVASAWYWPSDTPDRNAARR